MSEVPLYAGPWLAGVNRSKSTASNQTETELKSGPGFLGLCFMF